MMNLNALIDAARQRGHDCSLMAAMTTGRAFRFLGPFSSTSYLRQNVPTSLRGIPFLFAPENRTVNYRFENSPKATPLSFQ